MVSRTIVAEPESRPRVRRPFSSPLMLDRRNRILAEAHGLLMEKGVEGFSMREVLARSGVAQRTLYAAFGTKDELIVQAADQFFNGLMDKAPPPPAAADFEGMMQRIAHFAAETTSLKAYSKALAGVYFSTSENQKVHDCLYDINQRGGGYWLKRAVEERVLIELSVEDQAFLGKMMANSSYAVVIDWAADRISQGELARRWQLAFLTTVRSFVRPKHRATVDSLVRGLLEPSTAR